MVERLPTPWGLVRLGVAPDHPKLKEVSRAFEKIAVRPGFRFFGNIEHGRDVRQSDLAELYDAVVYAVGAQTDRRLGIPGEDLPGSWAATEFVAWYNGHPDFQDLSFDLSGADIVVDPAELVLDAGSEAELAGGSNIVQRNFELLRGFAAREPAGKPRIVRLRFRVSPVALLGDERVEAVEVAHNMLEPDGRGSVRAVSTDERETIAAGIVFRSVGYHGVPLPDVPFDPKAGTIPNAAGRVLDASGEPIPGLYAAGWIKRGPTGVIGTNKKDATETVDRLLEDVRAGRLAAQAGSSMSLEELLAERRVEAVVYAGWEAIDVVERGRGEPQGRPRIKLCTWDELLAAARG